MDKNNVINTAKLAVKFTNSFGVWKIMNWALDAVMPPAVKLPVRVCVRVAMWSMNGIIESKCDQYIDSIAASVSDTYDNAKEVIDKVKSEEQQEDTVSETSDDLGGVVTANYPNWSDQGAIISNIDVNTFSKEIERIKEKLGLLGLGTVGQCDAESVGGEY